MSGPAALLSRGELTRTKGRYRLCPDKGIDSSWRPTTMRVHFPAARGVPSFHRVNGNYDALATKTLGSLTNKFWVTNGGGVNADFVGADREDPPDIFKCRDSATNRKRNKHLFSNAGSDIEDEATVLSTSGNV